MPATPFRIHDGVVFLGPEWSRKEKELLDNCCQLLEKRGFTYLAIPSVLERQTYQCQAITDGEGTLIEGQQLGQTRKRLAGSAEQGILEHFAGQEVEAQLLYARNQCFRLEPEYLGLKRLREFQKVEQYIFCHPEDVADNFDFLLQNALDFLAQFPITTRIVDAQADPGYHAKKLDIEVWTRSYGWLETHSCSSFLTEQTSRFAISGAAHTLSNTGIASPRILVPLMEEAGLDVARLAGHPPLAPTSLPEEQPPAV